MIAVALLTTAGATLAELRQGAYVIGASSGTITNGDISAMVVLGEPISGTVETEEMQMQAGFIPVYLRGREILSAPEEPLRMQPETITLSNPYPNPFNSTTIIRYYLPSATRVSLVVFDLSGRQVAGLVNGINQAGKHSAVFQSEQLVSGLYLIRMTTAERTITQKVVLVK